MTIAGVISSSRTRTTKNNTLMSYIQLEDGTGTIELMVFQKTLDTAGAYIRDNAAIVVKGRISLRDEKEPQLVADSISPLTESAAPDVPERRETQDQRLWVKLPGRDDRRMRRIELILTMFPGEQQMVIWCEREKKRIGARCIIHDALIQELREMLGDENVVIK